MEQNKLRVVSVVDALVQALSEAIFNLEYQPGQQITEQEMAAKFNVSRNTVREATARMITAGLLVKEANRGIFVRHIGEEDVRELFRIRALLEAEAVRMISGAGRPLPESLLNAMESIEMDPNIQREWYRFVRSDLDFHTELVAASGSVRLARLYDCIRQEIMLSICQARGSLLFTDRNYNDHRKVIEALQRGDGADAEAILTTHIERGVENIARAFR